MDPDDETRIIHLRSGGVSLVLHSAKAAAPSIIYWGSDLGQPNRSALDAMALATLEPLGGNLPDSHLEVGVIPLESSGWMGRPGLAGHRDDGSSWAPRLTTTEVEPPEIGGKGDVLTLGPGLVNFQMSDAVAGLRIDLAVEMLPSGLARMRANLTNTDETAYHLEDLALTVPTPLTASEVLDFSGRWGREREPQRMPLNLGCWLREGRHGRTGFDAPTMTFCGEPGFTFERGEVWGLHVAASANHRTWVERCPSGQQVMGGGELLLPGEITLGRMESYQTPWIYLDHANGLDQAAHRVHDWLRSTPNHPDANRPVTLNVWEAVYFDHDLDKLLRLADRAAEIGVERYVLDDGWFLGRRDDTAGLGDWTPDPEVWPQGLHPLIDHVTGLGMQFGLWVEPEMINADSQLARDHPDWIMSASKTLPVEWRHQQVLNLSIPEAWEHVFAALNKLLTDYEISYFKWDENRDLIAAGDQHHAGRAAVHEQMLASYRLMDALRAAHPGLEIESCASGGGRIDLEMALHAQRFWLSDCIDPHERQGIMRWSGQILPPEMMGTHVASARSHTTGRTSSLSFRAITALWGHFGFEWDLLALDDSEAAELAQWVELYKSRRQLLLTGRLVRRDLADGSLRLHGIAARDHRRALYALTCTRRSPISPRGNITIPGLDDERTYVIRPLLIGDPPDGLIPPPWFGSNNQGIAMSGKMLRLHGVAAPLIYPDQAILLETEEQSN